MDYSIGEFSKRTGLGIHTLRYYEQEQLITPKRNAANRRRYAEQDIPWVEFILRLKSTGMPIREIKRYAALRREGDKTLAERMELLVRHREALDGQIRELEGHREKLVEKIAFYQAEILRYTEPIDRSPN